jgi:hypothetical protein
LPELPCYGGHHACLHYRGKRMREGPQCGDRESLSKNLLLSMSDRRDGTGGGYSCHHMIHST